MLSCLKLSLCYDSIAMLSTLLLLQAYSWKLSSEDLKSKHTSSYCLGQQRRNAIIENLVQKKIICPPFLSVIFVIMTGLLWSLLCKYDSYRCCLPVSLNLFLCFTLDLFFDANLAFVVFFWEPKESKWEKDRQISLSSQSHIVQLSSQAVQ